MRAEACEDSAQSEVFDPGISDEFDDETELHLEAVGDTLSRGRWINPFLSERGSSKQEGSIQ